jgi:hypothetical protein
MLPQFLRRWTPFSILLVSSVRFAVLTCTTVTVKAMHMDFFAIGMHAQQDGAALNPLTDLRMPVEERIFASISTSCRSTSFTYTSTVPACIQKKSCLLSPVRSNNFFKYLSARSSFLHGIHSPRWLPNWKFHS